MQVGPNKCGEVNHQSSINREDPFLILTTSNSLKSTPQVRRRENDRRLLYWVCYLWIILISDVLLS